MNTVYTQAVQVLALQQLQELSSFCILFLWHRYTTCVYFKVNMMWEMNFHNEIGVILLQSKTNYSLEWIVK